MKILFVQDSLGTGGAERSNATLWYYLRAKGIAFSIVVLEHRQEGIEREIVGEGFPVIFLKQGSFLSNSREIAAIIKAYKPTVVHSTLIRSNLRVRLAKLFASFYHVESLVNCTYDPIRLKDPRVGKAGFYLYKYLDRFTRPKGVDHSIAITREVEKHYQSQQGVPKERLSVIYRGRNENSHLGSRSESRRKLQAELGVEQEKVVLIHVGRQEYQKGHIYLLQALQHLYAEHQAVWDKLTMVFCGRRGNASEDIDAFMKKHSGLQANIHWLGHRHDVPELLAAADVFVFPSLYEGLGGALIEAQAAALPVVCSDIPVLHEVVNNNENALMFPVADAKAFSRQLATVIEDGSLRKCMREKSLQNFRKKFRLEQINEVTLDFYRKGAHSAL
ncbi:glycosyltransferase involved in cell wall biosynthesis [Pontibacter ummariensis]|uniref:Glycosyltransferase involved in cell wall bisynthesis n=1 Tax=Pontibacter ummariensis TaxID=1610492 RepID=A0A239EK49_9BACT|nr:glycosyltransferase family 4 protein [Pontibacter ummariensis]PRY13288.1 glycosyltransferase involved in cell wall biosynthesis [Pontibacter ummariensis]SNS44658.1 Glycosyltransferase involved in cell wall bisynthesis [Pontibacter ummariensis]